MQHRHVTGPVEGEVTDYSAFLTDNNINAGALAELESLSRTPRKSLSVHKNVPNQLIVLVRGASSLPTPTGTACVSWVLSQGGWGEGDCGVA